MRAVNKGDVPTVAGIAKTVADYKNWRLDLIDRLGYYCCYCNMPLRDSPQVEHVTPKTPRAGQVAGDMLAWDNMLLGCGPCNRKKGNRPVSRDTHYLPDFHNTHLVFDYVVQQHPDKKNVIACIPRPKTAAFVNAVKAKATIDLCGLDLIKDSARATDLRWKWRYEAFQQAAVWKKDWDEWGQNRAADFIRLLVSSIKAYGFFSIWLSVFADSPDVIGAIVRGIPGNNVACYDPNDFRSLPHNLP